MASATAAALEPGVATNVTASEACAAGAATVINTMTARACRRAGTPSIYALALSTGVFVVGCEMRVLLSQSSLHPPPLCLKYDKLLALQ